MPSHYSFPPIPADTIHAAQSVYSSGNIYLSIGDRLAELLADTHLENSAQIEAPSRLGMPSLALVTFFQYLEKLSDRQAEEATRTRIDWKYALHLSMNYPGLNSSTLCDFRQSLLSQPDRQQGFQVILERLKEGGFILESQESSPDTLGVVTEVCLRTRLDRAMASMQHTLQGLAIHYPEWLRNISLPYWYRRYNTTNHSSNLTRSVEQQQALLEEIGADIAFLLEAIRQADKPQLASLNEVQGLKQVWREQFDSLSPEGGKLLPYCYLCNKMLQMKSG